MLTEVEGIIRLEEDHYVGSTISYYTFPKFAGEYYATIKIAMIICGILAAPFSR